MNEIVIDISKFPEPLQEALRERAIRERKPLKQVLSEIIADTSSAILKTAGEGQAA